MSLDFFKKNKKEPKDFNDLLGLFRELERNFERVSGDLDNLKRKSQISFQKMGIVRYNPFSGVGGDQSFSVALLNSGNNGIVITSLYNLQENRIYAKTVIKGNSRHSLSKEEREAIDRAIRGIAEIGD